MLEFLLLFKGVCRASSLHSTGRKCSVVCSQYLVQIVENYTVICFQSGMKRLQKEFNSKNAKTMVSLRKTLSLLNKVKVTLVYTNKIWCLIYVRYCCMLYYVSVYNKFLSTEAQNHLLSQFFQSTAAFLLPIPSIIKQVFCNSEILVLQQQWWKIDTNSLLAC